MQQVTAQPAVRRNRAGRLGAYLAATGAGVGAVGTTAEAGVITIDVSSISGINAGLSSGNYVGFNPTPGGGNMYVDNEIGGKTGLVGGAGLVFAATGNARPTNLSAGATIDSSLSFSSSWSYSPFKYYSQVSPDFGPGSYMGFRDAQGRYGYFEVTWTAATSTFQILSGAYESVAGVAIVIPNAAPAVPEPSTLGLMALGAAGLMAARARQRKAEAAADPSSN